MSLLLGVNSRVICTDDLCLSNLKYFKYWDRVKEKHPDLKLIAFTIADYRLKELVSYSQEFKDWYENHKDWVEIAVHGYDHLYPPEAERDNFEECVEMARDILKPFLPEEFGYRSPGFKFTIRMEPCLKRLGFSYVAYNDRIKYFSDNRGILNVSLLNTHCCDRYENPITEIWREL